jgi:hypothetical protein
MDMYVHMYLHMRYAVCHMPYAPYAVCTVCRIMCAVYAVCRMPYAKPYICRIPYAAYANPCAVCCMLYSICHVRSRMSYAVRRMRSHIRMPYAAYAVCRMLYVCRRLYTKLYAVCEPTCRMYCAVVVAVAVSKIITGRPYRKNQPFNTIAGLPSNITQPPFYPTILTRTNLPYSTLSCPVPYSRVSPIHLPIQVQLR